MERKVDNKLNNKEDFLEEYQEECMDKAWKEIENEIILEFDEIFKLEQIESEEINKKDEYFDDIVEIRVNQSYEMWEESDIVHYVSDNGECVLHKEHVGHRYTKHICEECGSLNTGKHTKKCYYCGRELE